MEPINSVPQLSRLETHRRHDHLDIFRDFLDRLGRVPRGRCDKSAPDEMRGPNL